MDIFYQNQNNRDYVRVKDIMNEFELKTFGQNISDSEKANEKIRG